MSTEANDKIADSTLNRFSNDDANSQWGGRVKKHGSINRYMDNHLRTRKGLMLFDLLVIISISILVGVIYKNTIAFGLPFTEAFNVAMVKFDVNIRTETTFEYIGIYWQGFKDFTKEFIAVYFGNKNLINAGPGIGHDLYIISLPVSEFLLNGLVDVVNSIFSVIGLTPHLDFLPILKFDFAGSVDYSPYSGIFSFATYVFYFMIFFFILTFYQLYAQKKLINAALIYLYVPKWALWAFFNRDKNAFMYCKLLDHQLNKAVNSQSSEMAVSNIFNLGEDFINDKIEFKEIPKNFLKFYDYKKVVYIRNEQYVAKDIEQKKAEEKERKKQLKQSKKAVSNNSNDDRIDDLEDKIEEVEEEVEKIVESNKLDLDDLDNFEE